MNENTGEGDDVKEIVQAKTEDDLSDYYVPFTGHKIQTSQLDRQTDLSLSWNGEKSVWQAAAQGDVAALEDFLKNGVNVDVKDDEDCTPLIYSAGEGQNHAVEFLMNSGADVNIGDLCGVTPLMAAALGGHAATVRLLLDRGADVNGRSSLTSRPDETALAKAQRQGHTYIVKLLTDAGAPD